METKMKKIFIITLLIFATPALAQQVPTQAQRLQQIISNLIGESTELAMKLDQQALEIAKLQKQLADEKAKNVEAPK